MLQISQITLACKAESIEDKKCALKAKCAGMLHISSGSMRDFHIVRHSIDARKKPQLSDVWSVAFSLAGGVEEEKRLAGGCRNHNLTFKESVLYSFSSPSENAIKLSHRPVIAGAGPAGLFCALMLARNGYRPVLIERGEPMEDRIRTVTHFWQSGELNPDSNIQFGEGGAGTFSDGKLTTNVRDRKGRTQLILDTFIRYGAPPEIAYENLPHIGTDRLRSAITGIRNEIIADGGSVYWRTALQRLETDGKRLCGICIRDESGKERSHPAQILILAPGHSSRDLFRTLYSQHVPMEQKNFAVGMRISHPQNLINMRQYGISDPEVMRKLGLPPSSYKLTARAASGRGVYSFCMCPGGYIVNASSEPGRLAVNGMSDYLRDSKRANSAIVITVGPEEFGTEDVLAGMYWQEHLEEAAYQLAKGKVPLEWFPDYESGCEKESDEDCCTDADSEELCIKGKAAFAPLHRLLPPQLRDDFIEGMHHFDRIIPGFAGKTALVAGIESRTSSPVRILRDESGQSAVRGLYPCGEGAGYAGGIMSAALDGIRIAEQIGRQYRPL